MNKNERIKSLTVCIYELGMIRQNVENGYWRYYGKEEKFDLQKDKDLRSAYTGLLLMTDNKEFGKKDIYEMDLEEVRRLLIGEHYELLGKLRNELYSI